MTFRFPELPICRDCFGTNDGVWSTYEPRDDGVTGTVEDTSAFPEIFALFEENWTSNTAIALGNAHTSVGIAAMKGWADETYSGKEGVRRHFAEIFRQGLQARVEAAGEPCIAIWRRVPTFGIEQVVFQNEGDPSTASIDEESGRYKLTCRLVIMTASAAKEPRMKEAA